MSKKDKFVKCHTTTHIPKWLHNLKIKQNAEKDLGWQRPLYTTYSCRNWYKICWEMSSVWRWTYTYPVIQQFHWYFLQKTIICVNQKVCTIIFIAVLFVIAPNWKTQMSTSDDWIKYCEGCTTMEHYMNEEE